MTNFTFKGQLTASNSRDENSASSSEIVFPINGCSKATINKYNCTNIKGKCLPRSWIYVDDVAVKTFSPSSTNTSYSNTNIGWNGSTIDLTGHETLKFRVYDAGYYGGAWVRFDYEFILE